jgi:hypothetical protein
MNQLPNFKIEHICNELKKIDLALYEKVNQFDDKNTRNLIDKRRHLLASLSREIIANKKGAFNSSRDFYVPKPEIEQFINVWCEQIKTLDIQEISYKCVKFCNLLLDHSLPRSWNFDEDLMIIHQPASLHILQVAQLRNQKHVIVYVTTEVLAEDVNNFIRSAGMPVCMTPEDLERTVSLLQIPAEQVISISCESNSTIADLAKAEITNAVNAGKRTRRENTATVSKFGKSWSVNVLKNLQHLHNSKNLHQLRLSGVETAIIVASGPSLTKNVHKLKEIQESVFIVSALRSVPTLNAAGIEPDVVIQLDAEDDMVTQRLKFDGLPKIKNLLLEATVNNGFFTIPAQNIIWSLPQHFFDVHEKFGTICTPFNVPSVSIYALQLCQFLQMKNICFIGQDLAASSEKQYADGATDLLPAHADISMFKIEVPGFFGSPVITRNSYHYQIKRCSEIAEEWKARQIDVNLVNATEGGAYITGFDHMALESFIGKQQIRSLHVRKTIEFSANSSITPSLVASYLNKVNDTMTKISAIADIVIKLDEKPTKTRGLDKKIKKTISKFQELNNSTSLLQIAMQEEIARIIGTSREIETVDSYSQFFKRVKENALLLKAATE